jgi:hypothetical protein
MRPWYLYFLSTTCYPCRCGTNPQLEGIQLAGAGSRLLDLVALSAALAWHLCLPPGLAKRSRRSTAAGKRVCIAYSLAGHRNRAQLRFLPPLVPNPKTLILFLPSRALTGGAEPMTARRAWQMSSRSRVRPR